MKDAQQRSKSPQSAANGQMQNLKLSIPQIINIQIFKFSIYFYLNQINRSTHRLL